MQINSSVVGEKLHGEHLIPTKTGIFLKPQSCVCVCVCVAAAPLPSSQRACATPLPQPCYERFKHLLMFYYFPSSIFSISPKQSCRPLQGGRLGHASPSPPDPGGLAARPRVADGGLIHTRNTGATVGGKGGAPPSGLLQETPRRRIPPIRIQPGCRYRRLSRGTPEGQ